MIHPFEAVLEPSPETSTTSAELPAKSGRRGFLGRMASGLAAIGLVVSSAGAQAQNRSRNRNRGGDDFSTSHRRDGRYTTQALGEEGGRGDYGRGGGRYTTQALGEEGGGGHGGGRYTTYALGEEGGGYGWRDGGYGYGRGYYDWYGRNGYYWRSPGSRYNYYDDYWRGRRDYWDGGDWRYRDRDGRGRYTTYALGEEG